MTKTVFITGANKGIGFATARQLGAQGWTVLIGARDEQRGEAAVAQLRQAGAKAEWLKLDLNDHDTIHNAAAYISHHYPVLDGLINNAGISGDMYKELLALTSEGLMRTVEEGSGTIAKVMMDHQNHQGKILLRPGVAQVARHVVTGK